MQIERVNHTLEAAVNKGIEAALMTGVLQGIKVMGEEKVPVHIALRVILGPNLRRSTDYKD